MRRAAFIDKDGTLIYDVPYNVNPARIRLRAGAAAALSKLQAAGYEIILVTNQPGVAIGRFSERALGAVWTCLSKRLAAQGVRLPGIYYCPHHPQAVDPRYRKQCHCRKPRAGLLLNAARGHDVDLTRSWMVGDVLDDVEAAHRAGCRAVLLDAGSETEWRLSSLRIPDFVAPNFASVSRHILANRARNPVRHELNGSRH
jgi:D-glycero-D-manno-heptose 1,7-bisphosphate phosphatase